jgi:Zn-dependent metalloprotease/PKD repeat protein
MTKTAFQSTRPPKRCGTSLFYFAAILSAFCLGNPSLVLAANSPRPDPAPPNVAKPGSGDGRIFIIGDVGTVDPNRIVESSRELFEQHAPTGPDGRKSSYDVRWARRDNLGKGHVHAHQYWQGRRIIGGELRMQLNWEAGVAEWLNGRIATLEEVVSEPILPWGAAAVRASEALGFQNRGGLPLKGASELAYIVDDEGKAQLAWKAVLEYEADGDPHLDEVYIHHETAQIIAIHPKVHSALNRKIHTANFGSTLPGALVISEGGTSSDAIATAAYTNLGWFYNYFFTKHARDSYDRAGAPLTATIHYSQNYVNLFWNGFQLVSGDGDGVNSTALIQAIDLTGHEFTHGVTEREAGLIFSGESGALNESFSDIFGACIEAFRDGGITANTWKIGEQVWTPGTAGDALRYMNNPTLDGYSADYYPERLSPNCSPSSANDYCGIHGNSGIANLAFVLLVQGGTHPRGKTSVVVPALGLSAAEKIFYRALNFYLTSAANFLQMRVATASAAQDLFGDSAMAAVHLAWDAVGVPVPPTATPTPVTYPALQNGIPATNLSASFGNFLTYTFEVPAGAASVKFATSGGFGDADLYVKHGSLPTLTSYDSRSITGSNNEVCQVSALSGTWYVTIHAYQTFSGAQLLATLNPVNSPPAAAFDAVANGLTVTFTDQSADIDGSIISRLWSFGDGSSSSVANISHTYAAAGTYSPQLTVCDDDGSCATVSKKLIIASLPPCTDCDQYSGSLAQAGATSAEPNGSQYYAISGLHEGYLRGPQRSNFDLYLYKWVNLHWTIVARAEGLSSTETIRYTGTPGNYLWQIASVSGAGDYTFWLNAP